MSRSATLPEVVFDAARTTLKRPLALAVACIAAVTPAVAHATHSPSGQSQRDFAVGGGQNQFAVVIGDTRFGFAATSDPLGLRPSGHAAAHGDPDGAGPIEPFTAEGEVTCLRVVGNRAAFKWRFKQAAGSATAFEGGGVQAFVEDNGEPREGEPVDRAALDPPQPSAAFDLNAQDCDDPNLRNYDRLEQGNVSVHDASPR